jgi:hypothetical protein
MADQSLPEYLDQLIERAYVSRKRGEYPKSLRATEVSVRHYIEDEETGRAVPIDDSADHFLLMSFHRLRDELLDRPIPENTGFYGSVYHSNGTRSEGDTAIGEVAWRNKHEEFCNTCKMPTDRPSGFCSAGHLDIRTNMTADQPGKVRTISRTIPLRKEDEE